MYSPRKPTAALTNSPRLNLNKIRSEYHQDTSPRSARPNLKRMEMQHEVAELVARHNALLDAKLKQIKNRKTKIPELPPLRSLRREDTRKTTSARIALDNAIMERNIEQLSSDYRYPNWKKYVRYTHKRLSGGHIH